MIPLKNIEYEVSKEICEIDINVLDKMLLKMPAEMYIDLYVKMKSHIEHQCLDKYE